MPDDGGALDLHDTGVGAERILARLDALCAEVRELRVAIVGREAMHRRRLSRLHERKGSDLAVEIVKAIGDDTGFDVRELLECAKFDDGQLRKALDAIIGPFDAGMTRRIGRLLARVEGANLPCGFRVERCGEETARESTLWCVVRV